MACLRRKGAIKEQRGGTAARPGEVPDAGFPLKMGTPPADNLRPKSCSGGDACAVPAEVADRPIRAEPRNKNSNSCVCAGVDSCETACAVGGCGPSCSPSCRRSLGEAATREVAQGAGPFPFAPARAAEPKTGRSSPRGLADIDEKRAAVATPVRTSGKRTAFSRCRDGCGARHRVFNRQPSAEKANENRASTSGESAALRATVRPAVPWRRPRQEERSSHKRSPPKHSAPAAQQTSR